MMRTTTFTKGSGVYECRVCHRRTRDDGHGDSVNVRLCTQCYALAGIENMISDGEAKAQDGQEALALIADLESKGVRGSVWHELRTKAASMIEAGQ